MRNTLNNVSLPVLVLLFTGVSANGSVLQGTPSLPPTTGAYGLHATVCLLGGCIVESDVGNLTPTSSVFTGGNQMITATGVLNAQVFDNVGGTPGAFIGNLTLTGDLAITYVGRTSNTQIGSFTSLLTAFDFSGSFNSHTIQSQLVTGQGGNSGITTITPRGQDFVVDSFFDVFPAISLDGGPFVPGPERHVELEAAPEPGAAGLALLGVIGLAALSWRKRRAGI
jgi:hypothetical protein